jgi:hypothetical protein
MLSLCVAFGHSLVNFFVMIECDSISLANLIFQRVLNCCVDYKSEMRICCIYTLLSYF